MEMRQENITELIREKCSVHWELAVFNGHVIINLPDDEADFRLAYGRVKTEVTRCIRQHWPDRDSELLFEVRNSSWNCSFKLGKSI